MSNTLNITAADAAFAKQYNDQAKQAEHQASVQLQMGGISRATFSGDQVETSFTQGVARVDESSFKTGGIVGSLGLNKQHDKAVVSTPFGTMELRTAHSVGLVGRDANGHYFDLGEEPQKKVTPNQPTRTREESMNLYMSQNLKL